MTTIIDTIRQELIKNSDEHTRKTSQNYFKEKIKFYGVKVPIEKMPKELKVKAMAK